MGAFAHSARVKISLRSSPGRDMRGEFGWRRVIAIVNVNVCLGVCQVGE